MMTDYDPTEEHEPYDVDRAGASGVAKSVVTDVIEAVAGPDPYEDGTGPRKVHSAQVNVHLAPGVGLETVADVVRALERLNLVVHATEDGRFSDGVNARALRVQRKRFHGDQTTTWWEKTGVERGEDDD